MAPPTSGEPLLALHAPGRGACTCVQRWSEGGEVMGKLPPRHPNGRDWETDPLPFSEVARPWDPAFLERPLG